MQIKSKRQKRYSGRRILKIGSASLRAEGTLYLARGMMVPPERGAEVHPERGAVVYPEQG